MFPAKPRVPGSEPNVAATAPPSDSTRGTAPPWAGLHGSLGLQLKSIVYSDAVQVSNVTGRLRIDAGMMTLEGLQAGLGEVPRRFNALQALSVPESECVRRSQKSVLGTSGTVAKHSH